MKISQETETNILSIIKTNKPPTGFQLVEHMVEKLSVTEFQALEMLVELEDTGKLIFNQEKTTPNDFYGYLLSNNSRWYHLVTLVSFASVLSVVFHISDYFSPVRYLLGVFFVLFIPGYSVTRILYMNEETTYLKIILLSLTISVSFAAFVGIILNYSPFGINPVPVVLATLMFVLILSSSAIYMEYKYAIN